MRESRAPEGRGSQKRMVILLMGVTAIAAAAVIVFFSMGSDSISAKNDQTGQGPNNVSPAQDANRTPNQNTGAAVVALAPTATPQPAPTPNPTPTTAPTLGPEALSVPKVFPNAQYGEVLEEGLLDLRFPRGELVKTWYSFQVDTETRDITLYFAQYNDALDVIQSTVKIDDYTRGANLGKAEVTLNYADGSVRMITFDRENGTIELNQQYTLPVGPSMFSSGLRRAMVYYGMPLADEQGEIEVQLHLDLSGLSQSEGLEFTRVVPETVDHALTELRFLVEQIEDKRLRP